MQLAPLPPTLPGRDADRLRVRRLTNDDLEALVASRSHPDVARYQSWQPTWNIDDARALLLRDQQLAVITPGSWVQWVLEERDTGTFCGDIGLHVVDHAPRTVELGVTVAHAQQRKGLAREGLHIVLRWLLNTHRLHRAYAQLDARNDAAARLFQTLGFRKEAEHVDADWFKGEWSTLVVMAALRSDLADLLDDDERAP
jgi:RimJ/RimL family protein N-acetyltransferase